MPSIHKAPPPPAPSGMVLVPGGTFEMGRGGQPARKVQIDRFWMRATPVTQEEYQRITGRNSLSGDPLLPAENVSWYDALEFCNILSLKEGLTPAYSRSQGFIVWDLKAAGYRLPTEAEWEYAAQGAENDDSAGWYAENSGGRSRRVGEKKPNRAGLYDLLGNVWEWCWNWDEPSSGAETRGIWGGSAGTGKVVRGGSWNTPRSQARSANRRSADPLARYKDVGFRPVRSIFEPPAP